LEPGLDSESAESLLIEQLTATPAAASKPHTQFRGFGPTRLTTFMTMAHAKQALGHEYLNGDIV
jgi:hypothetical protein